MREQKAAGRPGAVNTESPLNLRRDSTSSPISVVKTVSKQQLRVLAAGFGLLAFMAVPQVLYASALVRVIRGHFFKELFSAHLAVSRD